MKKPVITITVEIDEAKGDTRTSLSVIAGQVKLKTVLQHMIPVLERLAVLNEQYPGMSMSDLKKEAEPITETEVTNG